MWRLTQSTHQSEFLLAIHRVFAGAVAVVAAVILFSPSPAQATPTEYVFSAGATLTFQNSVTETVSGTFYYDPSTLTESNAIVTLSGGGPYDGVYENWLPGLQTGGLYIDASLGGTVATVPQIDIYFGPSLDGTSTSYLGLVFYDSTLTTGEQGSGSGYVSPESSPPASTPEPQTLSLLFVGFAGLCWFRRRRYQ